MYRTLAILVATFWVLQAVTAVIYVHYGYEHEKGIRTFFMKIPASATYLLYAVGLYLFFGTRGPHSTQMVWAMGFGFLGDMLFGWNAMLPREPIGKEKVKKAVIVSLAVCCFGLQMVFATLAFVSGMADYNIPLTNWFWLIVFLPLIPATALNYVLNLGIWRFIFQHPLYIVPLGLFSALFLGAFASGLYFGINILTLDPIGGFSALFGTLFYMFSLFIFGIRATNNPVFKNRNIWAVGCCFYYLAQIALSGALLALGGWGHILLK